VSVASSGPAGLVAFPEPIDVAASLELFRRSGDDLIDRWDGSRLVRVLRFGQRRVPFVATVEGCSLRVSPATPEVLRAAAESFFYAPPGLAALVAEDGVLRQHVERWPGVRQPRQLDLFTALVRCISAQQVNLRWAVITRRRLAEAFGVLHSVDGHAIYTLEPELLAGVIVEEIRALQFTTSKARSIVAVAEAMVEGRISQASLAELSDAEVVAQLSAIRGIGRWSAEWVLARTLGRPCVVAGDLGVRKAVGLAYLGTPRPTEEQVRQTTAHWHESAGVAQATLLHALGERTLGPALPALESRPTHGA
jgi:DNA-3-methyladenine glycosylase II